MSRSYISIKIIGEGTKLRWRVLDLGLIVRQGIALDRATADLSAGAAKEEYLNKIERTSRRSAARGDPWRVFHTSPMNHRRLANLTP